MIRRLLLCALLLVPVRAAAQDPAIEVWGAVSAVLETPTGTVVSDYSPPLLLDGTDFVSHGGQTLSIATPREAGASAGINLFLHPHVGVQLLAERTAFDVSGANSPYAYTLRYVSRQPPDYVPQTFTTGNTVPWPDSSGSLTELWIALNAVARIGDPQRTNVTLSGGPALVRMSGTIEPLGYTAYHLGGHAVLFEDDYRLAVDLGPDYRFGFDAGGDLNVGVGRHFAVMLGYRYFRVRGMDVAASPTTIRNPDQIGMAQSIGDIAAALAPIQARITPSRSRLVAGLKLRF